MYKKARNISMNIYKQQKTYFHFGKSDFYYNIILSCDDGFQLTLSSIGASIRQLLYPFPDGNLKNIVLSFTNDEAYFSNFLYAGATLAPCAGRISNGCLPVGNIIYSLSCNENSQHTLHGGFQTAAFSNWNLQTAHTDWDHVTVVFNLSLPDGLDGFPGNRKIIVSYILQEDHTLTIHYEAISDQDTYFNISNHTYFNLNGDFSLPIFDHLLEIQAENYICNRIDFIPEYILPVKNTPFDFRKSTLIKTNMQNFPSDKQLLENKGYNHAFILNHTSNTPDLHCTAINSPLHLKVISDSPCMVLYSGGFIESGLSLSAKQKTMPSCALAFEFQDYPDAPGKHAFPYSVSPAGETWKRTITYKFSRS